MSAVLLMLAVVPGAALLATLLIPSRVANRHAGKMGEWVSFCVGLQALWVLVASFSLLATPPADGSPTANSSMQWAEISGLTLLMLGLVSLVGWSVARYSVRYLAGDVNQGRFFRWLGVTLGAVSLMAISGNLLFFGVFWCAASLSLHPLLIHFNDSTDSHEAARTKFILSRLGDAFVVVAVAVLWSKLGTLTFSELRTVADAASGTDGRWLGIVGWCVITATLLKSAVFPFHWWLPETLDTPTPVSALMHAGIVNAGGYLLVRMNPVLGFAIGGLETLIVIGTATAVLGSLVMMTQTSIKRSLAYSTVAQMGFMLLQCGLGAYVAAMLHIVAHALYKAYSFLASGSILADPTTSIKPASSSRKGQLIDRWGVWFVALAALTACAAMATRSEQVGHGWTLGFVLAAALTSVLFQAFEAVHRGSTARLAALVGMVLVLYAVSYGWVSQLVDPPTPSTSPHWCLHCFVVLSFAALLIVQLLVRGSKGSVFLQSLYVHASNGFYVKECMRRIGAPAFITHS